MMTLPKMIGHSEIVPDTVPMPTANRTPVEQIKVQVVPTGGPARALTQDLQSIRKKAWALN